jgi:hypothetical protein
VSYSDFYGDGYGSNSYTMSERANTFGLDFLHGNEFNPFSKYFDIDLFYGLGVHERFRNYNISNQSYFGFINPSNSDIAYDGNYTNVLTIVTPVVGLRVGFNYVKKS